MVRVCILGLQMKFNKKKGKFWKSNQVNLLEIEVQKLVSLENFQNKRHVIKFPSRHFNNYFANNLSQKISPQHQFVTKLQQINYRLCSSLFMRNYLFYEQHALEQCFMWNQFVNTLQISRLNSGDQQQ